MAIKLMCHTKGLNIKTPPARPNLINIDESVQGTAIEDVNTLVGLIVKSSLWFTACQQKEMSFIAGICKFYITSASCFDLNALIAQFASFCYGFHFR